MIVPNLQELRRAVARFAVNEQISWNLVLHPFRIIDILLRYRFLHFLVVGGGGVALALGTTWVFTVFIFGLEGYFSAYLIGTVAGLLFNFTMYTLVIFRTSQSHGRRLAIYLTYMVCIIIVQAVLVRTITPLIGLQFYLLVITFVIGVFSTVNFFVFKLSLFKEEVYAQEHESQL
jgi:putative flippase GtrA